MKRFTLVILASIAPLILGSCQEKLDWEVKWDTISGDPDSTDGQEMIVYEEILTLNGNRNPYPQGGDCWGDYFFQFVSNNSIVRIYDLSLKTLVQTLTIPASQRGFVSNCHCNTVSFGSEYYDAEDLFPLIYVSTGYPSGDYMGALVYRITLHNGRFFITLVQTLKFPIDNSPWTEFIPAGEFAYLCYTQERVIFKVKMPKLKDGDVILGRNDALESYQFKPQSGWLATSKNQDRMFFQGKIVFPTGAPQAGEASAFVVLNLETCERERIIDFKKNGLTSESESVFIWQGDICVAFVDKIVRLFL